MFDVNKAVHLYSRSIATSWFRRSAQIVELEDHLHCEIEQFVASGMSTEMAFVKATSRLGEKASLKREFRKNKRRLPVFRWEKWKAALNNKLVHPHFAVAGILLVAMVPAVMYLFKASVARSALNVFEACCAVSGKIIGLFG